MSRGAEKIKERKKRKAGLACDPASLFSSNLIRGGKNIGI
jgi:hypothetical protein